MKVEWKISTIVWLMMVVGASTQSCIREDALVMECDVAEGGSLREFHSISVERVVLRRVLTPKALWTPEQTPNLRSLIVKDSPGFECSMMGKWRYSSASVIVNHHKCLALKVSS